jgi:hypothetical protein
MSLRSILGFSVTHLLVAGLGFVFTIGVLMPRQLRAEWSTPDHQLGIALARAHEHPDEALLALDQRQDIPARTRRIFALWVNARAAQRAAEPYTTRAVDICHELNWPVCDSTALRAIADVL